MASIRKRTWRSRGVERTAWVVDYLDNQNKRRLKTFSTRKEADRWAVTTRHEVKQGIHTPESISKTIAEAAELWIAHCEAEGLEYSTIRQRRQHLNLHIAQFIGLEKLGALTAPRIYQFDAQLRDAGRSIAMRRKVLTNVKTLLTFAQAQGLVAQNVARGVRVKNDDRNKADGPLRESIDFPSKAEIKALIDNAPDRWRALIVTAAFTGMRASELRGLRWSDIELEEGIIHVRQRADAWRNIGKPKSKAGSRDIPLAPMVVNALRRWQPDCPTGELNLVFPNGAGQIDSLTNIRKRVWLPLLKKCGLVNEAGSPKYTIHSLRHAAASLFIAYLGWTPKRVQAVMGHSSIAMTFDRYGHLFEDHEGDREAMKKLEAAIIAA